MNLRPYQTIVIDWNVQQTVPQLHKRVHLVILNLTIVSTVMFKALDNVVSIFCPDLKKILPSGAFRFLKNLVKIDFPVATYIGDEAFMYCDRLVEIHLPEAKFINTEAFFHCERLKKIHLPKVKTIGRLAFAYCSRLEQINFPDATELHSNAFGKCCSLYKIDLPKANFMEYVFDNDCLKIIELIGLDTKNIPMDEKFNFLKQVRDHIYTDFTKEFYVHSMEEIKKGISSNIDQTSYLLARQIPIELTENHPVLNAILFYRPPLIPDSLIATNWVPKDFDFEHTLSFTILLKCFENRHTAFSKI